MTRILVCGGRYYDDQDRVDAILDQLHAELGIAVLIQGGQKWWCRHRRRHIGADFQAKTWAEKRGIPGIEEPAKWDVYGQRAGMIRNGIMLRIHTPDRGVAFPGHNGTADMVRKMRAAGVPVLEVPAEKGTL